MPDFPVISSPSYTIFPVSGFKRPAIILKRVLLPLPLTPSNDTSSFLYNFKLTLVIISLLSYAKPISLASKRGSLFCDKFIIKSCSLIYLTFQQIILIQPSIEVFPSVTVYISPRNILINIAGG